MYTTECTMYISDHHKLDEVSTQIFYKNFNVALRIYNVETPNDTKNAINKWVEDSTGPLIKYMLIDERMETYDLKFEFS